LYELNSNTETHFRAERIAYYFNLLAYEILAAFRKDIRKLNLKDSRKKELVLEFLNQLSLHSRKERSVRFYADQLSVTPDYLSKVLKEVSGMTTRDIIEESVVMEARTLLENTPMSISQISEHLQFSDQSFFGKFFKRKMKISPHAYRNQRK
jgi:AraC-like DNA-binding protein